MMYAFLFIVCLPNTTQCARLEAEAPSMSQCLVLRDEAQKKYEAAYVGKCEEIDVD